MKLCVIVFFFIFSFISPSAPRSGKPWLQFKQPPPSNGDNNAILNVVSYNLLPFYTPTHLAIIPYLMVPIRIIESLADEFVCE